MKILIVDDEVVSREKMRNLLSLFGDCVAVDNGADAIDAMHFACSRGEFFDLITLDINMPGMGGDKALKAIREIESDYNTIAEKPAVILMVTSEADKDKILTCHAMGCNDYIIKPFNPRTIEQKLLKFGFTPLEPDRV